jgi:hypothetical protein
LAELGFLGEIVKTRKQTAFFCGFPFSFGLAIFFTFFRFGEWSVCEKVDIKK